MSGPSHGSCPQEDWETFACVPDEPRLSITAPGLDDTLLAGQAYSVQWSGGSEDGTISIYLLKGTDHKPLSGLGLPENSESQHS